MLDALQSSRLAHAIAESQLLTASLSSFHVLGFALVMGSALLSNLQLAGLMFPAREALAVTSSAACVLVVGLCVSAFSGALLFIPRAYGAAMNSTFRVKISLLLAAAFLQFVVQRRLIERSAASHTIRLTGIIGMSLWLGVALAGCAFILLE